MESDLATEGVLAPVVPGGRPEGWPARLEAAVAGDPALLGLRAELPAEEWQ